MDLAGQSMVRVACVGLCLLSLGATRTAHAEGSAQVGVGQRLRVDTVLRVDVLIPGEVMHISGRNSESAPLSVTLTDPDGQTKTYALEAGAGLLLQDTLPSTICDGLMVVADKAGVWQVQFHAEGQSAEWERTIAPFDISMSPAGQACVSPTGPVDGGRLHSLDFHLRASGFDRANATNADFYVVASSLTGDAAHVWLLDFEGLAGWDYHVAASRQGLDQPYSYTSQIASASPAPHSRADYPIYLTYPARPWVMMPAPEVSTRPIQGRGLGLAGREYDFAFTSNVESTYQLVVDLDDNGRFEPSQGDLSLTGTAQPGDNHVRFSGRDATGAWLPPKTGALSVLVALRSGEFHFVGYDIETARPGLAVFGLDPKLARLATQMHWDDRPVLSLDPTRDANPAFSPAGGVASSTSRHGWGDFTARAPGDNGYIDTWVFGREASTVILLPWLSADGDFDGDGLTNATEQRLGTLHDETDSDGDGVADGVEARSESDAPDSDGDGTIDALDADSHPATVSADAGAEDGGSDGKAASIVDGGGGEQGLDAAAPESDSGEATPNDPASPASSGDPRAPPPGAGPQPASQPVETAAQVTQDGLGTTEADAAPELRQSIVGGAVCTVRPSSTRTGPTDVWTLLCVSLGLLLSRRRRVLALSVLTVVSMLPGSARAERAVQLEQYRPAPSYQDGFVTRHLGLPRHLAWESRGDLSLTKNPLVLETLDASGRRSTAIVARQLSLSLAAALGLYERALLYASLAMSPLLSGEENTAVPNVRAGLGDLRLGVRVVPRVLRHAPFRVGFEAEVTLPSATLARPQQRLAGESTLTWATSLLMEGELGPVRLDGSLGARVRPNTQIAVLEVGPELSYAGGVSIGMTPFARVYGELFGARPLARRAVRGDAPVEVMLGLRAKLGQLWLGPMVGAGLSTGYGAPTYRIGVSVGHGAAFAQDLHENRDRDRDGVRDAEDACPDLAEDRDAFEDADGCPDPDNDRDEVPDERDGAPLVPEDRDSFQDHDGVPDPDNDQDGVLDERDGAPTLAEDRDGFDDEDGVPDLDNDRDAVPDERDGAPLLAEDLDGFADHDGVPETDNDGDGLDDTSDLCPLSPGNAGNKGCTGLARHDVKEGMLWLAQRVEFASDSDVLEAGAIPVLDEVRAILLDHPELRLLRVEGHTDGLLDDSYNLDLSARRAATVAGWLVQHAIERSRLEAYGCGERRPIDDNESDAGRAANRRVEMHVLAPEPVGGPRSTRGCVEALPPADALRPLGPRS